MASSSVAVRFQILKRGSHVDALIKFLETIDSMEFNFDIGSSFGSGKQVENFERLARSVIEGEIYAVGEDRGRSWNAWRSMKAQNLGVKNEHGNCGGIQIYSDKRVAGAIAGDNPGHYSYVGFFEDPNIGAGSFIPPKGALTPSRYRPFVKVLSNESMVEATESVSRITGNWIRHRLPGSNKDRSKS